MNVGASQARRRLKGFGHGVRQVQSAGNHRAVIIHTATGRHLEELKEKFSDVGYSASASDWSDPIDNLRNVGPASANWLREIGVQTVSDLQRLGPSVAYRAVKQRHPEARVHLLWSLAAGLSGRDGQDLSEDEKRRLLEEAHDG